jgi:hypothetical protein
MHLIFRYISEIMGSSTFSKHDLEMIEISWSFVKDKELLGLNTMVKIFESSNEIKNLFGFASNLESSNEMIKNTRVRYHANQVINTLDKIIILLTKSFLSEQDKELLIELGERHYHYGLKIEYFKVYIFI